MNKDQLLTLYQRIDNLKMDQKAAWGKMNVSQMVCHCADQIRLALGTKMAMSQKSINPKEIIALAKAGKTVPTPPGFDQVAGEGTPPIDFESDKQTLKGLILEFSKLDKDFDFPPHPYFGTVTRERWNGLLIYHLDYHLKQFGV